MELTQIVKLEALGLNHVAECTSHCDVSINIIRQAILLMKEQIFSLNFVLKEGLFTFSKEAQKTSRPIF